MLSRNALSLCFVASLAMSAACGGDDDGGSENENEVFTTVSLSFAPASGGTAITAAFDDADGDGGAAPVIDPINLSNGATYTVTVRFQNKLETPPEEITDEVRDESDEHQIFFTGTAVNGPASNHAGAPLTHSYADTDASGNPIGLSNAIVAATGTGELTLTLRHLPPVNDVAVKTANLATEVRDSGFASLPGSTDVQVNFPVTVP
jgi:hypothetical protein